MYYSVVSNKLEVFRLLAESSQPLLRHFSITKCIVRLHSKQILAVAMELGFSVNGTTESVLHTAVTYNSVGCMDILLKSRESLKLDLSMQNTSFAEGPLHTACGYGNPDAMMLLMTHGADTDEANADGDTPIFCCIDQSYKPMDLDENHSVACIRNLIRFGCDLEPADYMITPLHLAMGCGHGHGHGHGLPKC